MYNIIENRRKKILEELNETGKVCVLNLAKQFNVSLETIRRDLDYLEKEGKVTIHNENNASISKVC